MEKVTIKTYAIKHKLSIFNVVKMVKSGELNTIVEEEKDKEVTYILWDNKKDEKKKNKSVPLHKDEKRTLENEIMYLKKEVILLRTEIEEIKQRLNL